jgi:hypothetical protein
MLSIDSSRHAQTLPLRRSNEVWLIFIKFQGHPLYYGRSVLRICRAGSNQRHCDLTRVFV